MIKAVIYDMDGIIIDSEPLWRKAEIKSLGSVGVSLTEDMCRQTMALRIDEVVEYWFRQFPWKNTSKKQVEASLWKNILQLIKDEGSLKKGVIESLEFVKKKNFKIALASTSYMILIKTVLEKFHLTDYFKVIHSAEFEEYGKPHPGVYIHTANKLGVGYHECVGIEDSINGMIAVKAAKMKCIAIPEKELMNDKRVGIADIVISSLLMINEKTLIQLNM